MLKEFVDRLQQLSNDAMRPYPLELDKNDPRRAYVFKPKTGVIDIIPLAADWRDHKVSTLPSLASAFGRYKAGHKPSLWVAATEVVVILDDNNEIKDSDDPNGDDTRCNKITFPVVPSPAFKMLQNLPAEQADLLAAVRHDLKPCMITPDNFGLAISALKWQTVDTATGEFGTFGTLKSTMGRDVQAEVRPGSDIPPEISVTFQPYPALAEYLQTRVTVDCSVVIDPAKRLIHVRPYPGQIEMAITKSVEALRARIVELLEIDDNMVFAGTP